MSTRKLDNIILPSAFSCGEDTVKLELDLQQRLMYILREGFEIYKSRLNDSVDQISQGKNEFEAVIKPFTKMISEFDPINVNFSISTEPSLHYSAFFKDKTALFIETYLENRNLDNLTVVEILKDGKSVFQDNDQIDSIIENLEKELSEALEV